MTNAPAIRAGAVYFALLIAAGFVLGTIRVLLVAPAVGETAAVLIELPFMLTIAWLACRWLVRHFAVTAEPGARAAMAATAFVMLIIAEYLLAIALNGQSLRSFLAAFTTAPGAIGLAGQILAGCFPNIQMRMR